MLDLTQITNAYLEYCRYQKTLDTKTIKAYNIDLKQFFAFLATTDGNLNKSNGLVAKRALALLLHAGDDEVREEVKNCRPPNDRTDDEENSMTPTSLLPQEALAAGSSYNDLCERITRGCQ